MDRRLLKFKYGSGSSDKKVLIKFEVENSGDYDTFTFESNDDAHPDLRSALKNLAPHLLENCEVEDNRLPVNVLGVTCTYKTMESGLIRGLVITGARDLEDSNSPLVLNSPHKTDFHYSETDESGIGLLKPKCLELLDDLIREVFAYLDGKRAQAELDFGKKENEEAPREIADRVLAFKG